MSDNGKSGTKVKQQEPPVPAEPKRTVVNETFWTLLSAVQSGDLYRSTKGVNCAGGVLISVSSERSNKDGSKALAESITYIPGARLSQRLGQPFIEKH
jgi:hypothetical protein